MMAVTIFEPIQQTYGSHFVASATILFAVKMRHVSSSVFPSNAVRSADSENRTLN